MDLTKLFNISYLFEKYPDAGFSWPIRITLLIIFIGAILLAIYAQINLKKQSGLLKRVWYKLQVWGWTTGLVGLTLFYFREVRAIYLSSRFWLILFFLLIIVWIIFILKFWKKKVPDKEQRTKEEQEFKKWLPKQK